MGIAIQVQDLCKQFSPDLTFALDHVSANINAGQITGLVGPDGAGKTTLIRLMTGLMHPTTGKIEVCGLDTVTQGNAIQDLLGYMPQKFGLYEDLTVMENLELYSNLKGVNPSEKAGTFKELLEFTDLKRFTKVTAGRLSGGMKQKLGLACSLLSHPKILLLDEPSVGVDPISRRELWKIVQNLVKEGLAVVWSTAYLDEAELCTEVILLNEGKVLFAGPPHVMAERVEGRVFHIDVPPSQLRSTLDQILNERGVLDGVIQGRHLRITLEKNTKLDFKFPLIPVRPRFEDAFIDMLKGNFSRRSVLAEHIAAKLNEKEIPIEAKNLTKRFGDFTAAKNISFAINRGEIFGLLGPNGAGKSTTFKMLCGLLQPTEGKALVVGLDLKTASSKARARIGYMAQKFSLYSDLSVYQNLEFFAGVYGLKGKKKRQKIEQMVEIFDLRTYLNVNSGLLPLGFKQRLALSCALMHEPDVLFLDEPTSGVDPLTRREFWTHINGMVQKGVTIMITTHFMDEAEYCDRIGLIYRGENIATDTPDALKEQVRSKALPDPTLEDAFIALIERTDAAKNEASVA